MAKNRGYPDRRGMGAQSDFVSETFVPSEQHSQEQLKRAAVLIASGIPLADVARMLSVSVDWLTKALDGPAIPDLFLRGRG